MKKLVAEFIGTFWLVFGGCGSAILACNFPGNGIAYVGVAWAFGLTVVTMAYAFGHISGAHLNPAVSVGAWVAGRLETKNLLPYIIAQVLGGIAGAAILYVISRGNGSEIGSFATNGFGKNSPGHYSMLAALITEIVLTFIFLIVILGSTDERAPKGFAGLAIGLCLTLIHLISIPVTNTSVNPARSTSQAIFVGGEAINQLWLFWLAPMVGAILAGIVYKCFFAVKD